MVDGRTLIRLSEVLSVQDDQAGLRIKVRLLPEDADCSTVDTLPYCFPLLPKHLHVNPKVGECVLVLLSRLDEAKSIRYFIGPLVSQAYGLNFSSAKGAAQCLLLDNSTDPNTSSIKKSANPYQNFILPDPKNNPENKGSYPDREDIAIQGRQNADLILKNNELRLRCGYKKEPDGYVPNTLLFNDRDLAYIQMRYKRRKDETNTDYSSSINIVADKINLLSSKSPGTNYQLGDPDSLITDEEQLKILQTAHPLVFGDDLIEWLRKLISVFQTHTHPFSMDPPTFTEPQLKVLQEPLEQMLSTAVKIN